MLARKDMSTINSAALGLFFPLCYMTNDELELLAEQVIVFVGKKGKRLVELGTTDHKALYLVRGRVLLENENGKKQIIEEYTRESKSPISFSNPHKYTVTCDSTVEFLRIDNHIIANLLERHQVHHNQPFDYALLDNPVFFDIFRDLSQDRLTIPTLPKLALNIRKAIDDDADLRKIEILIQADPTLALMLIKTANSVLYRRTTPALTIEKAIIRLGMQTIKNLVTSYSLKSLFRTKSKLLQQRMQEIWMFSTEVAALSYVLARRLMKLDPEQALLLGLLHNISILPIISYAEKYPEFCNESKLDEIIEELSTQIGPMILDQWELPQNFIDILSQSKDWFHDSGNKADYVDVLVVARYHAMKSQNKADQLPDMETVPAFKKLSFSVNLEQNDFLMNDVNSQVGEVRKLLSM